MNQSKTHILRSLFLGIPSFSPTDPRHKTAWRQFKRTYNEQPKNQRFRYVAGLRSEVDNLKAITAEQPVSSTV